MILIHNILRTIYYSRSVLEQNQNIAKLDNLTERILIELSPTTWSWNKMHLFKYTSDSWLTISCFKWKQVKSSWDFNMVITYSSESKKASETYMGSKLYYDDAYKEFQIVNYSVWIFILIMTFFKPSSL